ncbi:non-selective voltage-gated ion channel VDAC2-like [Tachypleus tridentatus]|uniref:non-selective voltage-gated ion channel VDAC2-like n=1 Tax=Tachypleus tridentatus TaxID=6853 RepID=UPI003FCFC370
MAPPCFADLGKDARDIFSKNYHFGIVKLECKTKTLSGVDFTVSGTSNSDSGKVNGSLETKYKLSDYGLTLKEKWNTDSTLATEVTVEDQLIKGLKLALNTSFSPPTGKKSGILKGAYKMDHINFNTDIDFTFGRPLIHSAAIFHYQGWLAGGQVSFDTMKNMLTKANFAIGYSAKDFVFHTNVNNSQEFSGSVYQKVNDKMETAVQVSWNAGTNATSFGLGCIYKMDNNTSMRAKINNNSQIGLGFTHRLRDGVQLTLSTMLEGKQFNQGGHKLGIGLDLDA